MAVCVLGTHRSGTSAMTRLLNLLGMELGKDMLPADPTNPKGYWELRAVVEFQAELLDLLGSYYDDFLPLPGGWEKRPEVRHHYERLLSALRGEFVGKPLWGVKDPRSCRMLPMWHSLFKEMNVKVRFIIAARHPLETAASLVSRDGYALNHALLTSLHHILEAEKHTRGHTRVIVTYDQLINEWQPMVQRIGATLGIVWPQSPESAAQKIHEFIDPGLRHHAAKESNSNGERSVFSAVDPQLRDWADRVYNALAANAGGGSLDVAALDGVAKEISEASPRLEGWRNRWSYAEKFGRLSQWSRQMDAEIRRLSNENQQFRVYLGRRPAWAETQVILAEAQTRIDAAEARAAEAEAALDVMRRSMGWNNAAMAAAGEGANWTPAAVGEQRG
jgi:hypothetical protein